MKGECPDCGLPSKDGLEHDDWMECIGGLRSKLKAAEARIRDLEAEKSYRTNDDPRFLNGLGFLWEQLQELAEAIAEDADPGDLPDFETATIRAHRNLVDTASRVARQLAKNKPTG